MTEPFRGGGGGRTAEGGCGVEALGRDGVGGGGDVVVVRRAVVPVVAGCVEGKLRTVRGHGGVAQDPGRAGVDAVFAGVALIVV